MSAASTTPPAAADPAAATSESKASPRSERGPADHHQDSDPPNSSPRSLSGNKRSLEPDADGSDDAGSVGSSPPRKRSKSQQRPDDDSDADHQPLPEGEDPPPLPVGESPPPLPIGEESPPPPLPIGEDPPPLPNEPPPEDDGWDALWDEQNQAYYFHNRFTKVSQWENPRVPEAGAAETEGEASASSTARPHGGYNPAIHGDYDPNADYAVAAREAEEERANAASAAQVHARAAAVAAASQTGQYDTTGAFNRFTGQWQSADQNAERHNDENKSKRQMNAFFDVDAAANSHGGRSLKAERQSQKLSKAELKAFKEKRRERKEEKRRAWLRD